MKKNRVLRNWIITGLVCLVITLGVLVVGMLFTDPSVFGLDLTEGASLGAIAWLPAFTYKGLGHFYGNGLEEMFTAMFSEVGWASLGRIIDNVIWWLVVVICLVFFITILVKAIRRKSGKYIWFAVFFFLFSVVCVGCTTGYYFARHIDWSLEGTKVISEGFVGGTAHYDHISFITAYVNALVPGLYSKAPAAASANEFAWVVSVLTWVLSLAVIITIVAYLGMAFTVIRRLRKPVEEVVEEPVQVAEPVVEPEVAPVEEKKKGILVVRRFDKYGNHGPLVEVGEEDYPRKPIKAKPLTIEDVKRVIQEEVEKAEARRIVEEYKNEKQAQAIAAAIVKASGKSETTSVPVVSQAVEGKKEEGKVYPSPVIFAMPTDVKEEGEKVEEAVEKPVAPKKENKGLTEDQVKEIIASEIREALKDFVIKHEKVVEKQVEVKVPAKEPIAEEVKEEPAPVEEVKAEETKEETVTETVVETNPIVEEKVSEEVVTEEVKPVETPVEETKVEEVKEEVPAEEVKEEVASEPVVEEVKEEPAPVEEAKEETPAPEVKEEPVVESVVAPVAETTEKPKIIRIPFTTRMLEADQDLKDAYNHIKSLLKSYGLNNRVANGGDSFRLHRVTYCKITIAGKSLKLYLALDPKDYVDTTYPVKDASSKNLYKETPLVFKVKSGLSLRRAEELIRDCMDKHGLEQIDQIQPHDWVSELTNEAVEDDGDVGDEE